ncbi:MAG: hypothetical protein C0421_00955 [Hyphomonas sp.]|uniref:NepR family anti-sigma factor n=1 Tax=Hyphomonas sp. TaxID=87 RepID=UPI0025C1D64B|nr:NepR family anti-sigma factor [Hyphomonas sp.]MBA4337398.1 hypothetical protein [Hyphomonas sp.]
MSDTRKPEGGPSDGPKSQRRLGNRAIGERLRQMYEGVVDESIPDEFLKLLEEAEAAERSESGQPETGTS